MNYFGIGCLQFVVVCVLYGKVYGSRSLDDFTSDEDALVNQLPKYLNRRPYTRYKFRKEDSIIHPEYTPYAADNHNLRVSKVRLRPHSRLVEELESEDDLVNQIAQYPLEEEELRNVVGDKHRSYLGPREAIFVPNYKHVRAPEPIEPFEIEEERRKSFHDNSPQKHRPLKGKWGGKFGYPPTEPEFFAPVDSFTNTDEANRPHAKKSEVKNEGESHVEIQPKEVDLSTFLPPTASPAQPVISSSTERTGTASADASSSRTKNPENYEIVEGYYQKHNFQGYEVAVNETVPVTNASTIQNSKVISSIQSVGEPIAHAHVQEIGSSRNALFDFYFTVLVAGCTAALVGALIAAGVCWYRLQRGVKAAADVEYPAAYRGSNTNSSVTTPESRDRSLVDSRASTNSSSSADRKLAQSAHMFHYQHQKQQVLAMERNGDSRHGSASGVDSDDDNEEGDYTVYECPGLAPTGEMEVKNPMFLDDPTPLTPTLKKESSDL